MAAYHYAILLIVSANLVLAQRPFYAGRRPIGYPQVEEPIDNTLQNRFGEGDKIPIEALGDRNLVNRLDRMPTDQQPFWYLNWQAYEDLRNRPQVYPQRPSFFASNQNNIRN